MTLGMANQLEDRKGSTVQFEKPVVHVRLPTSSTCETSEPQQGNIKRENEQMALGVANHLEDRKGSTVQFEKPIVHDVGLLYVPSSTYRTYET